jgi:hypothetical protein
VSDSKQKMTEQETWNVLQFATSLYNGLSGYGYYNPYTQQQNLIDLNNDPLVPTYEKIIQSLKNNPYEAKNLCGYSEFMEVFDSIYGRTLKYLESLLSIDLYWSVTNIKDVEEYKSEEYKKDLRRLYKFLDSFDYKQEFRKIVKECLRKETVFTCFRDSHEIDTPIDIDNEDSKSKIKKNEKFGIQILPQRYCKLTGYYDNSQLLFDFDYTYFMRGTTDINLYAPSFKRNFRRLFDEKDPNYNPANQLEMRNGQFATWIQCSPVDGAWAFKTDVSNFRQTPPLASLMKSCFKNTEIQELQSNKDLLSARALVYGAIRLFDNAKSGTTKNQFSIDPNTLGELMHLVAQSLKYIQPIAMPTDENKFDEYQDYNPDMLENQLVSSAGQGVSASSMIYTKQKMMQFELQNAVETDWSWIAHSMYPQFEAFLNYFINRKMSKYKFKFTVNGCDRLFYQSERRKALNELFTVGLIPNTSYIASVYGIRPQDFDRMLDESHNSGLTDKLTMLMNKNTMSGMGGGANSSGFTPKQSSNPVGNPTKDTTDLKQGGSISRDYQ